jgi:hypothetical protein
MRQRQLELQRQQQWDAPLDEPLPISFAGRDSTVDSIMSIRHDGSRPFFLRSNFRTRSTVFAHEFECRCCCISAGCAGDRRSIAEDGDREQHGRAADRHHRHRLPPDRRSAIIDRARVIAFFVYLSLALCRRKATRSDHVHGALRNREPEAARGAVARRFRRRSRFAFALCLCEASVSGESARCMRLASRKLGCIGVCLCVVCVCVCVCGECEL